ncbi:MAG: IS4 family transposase, partial [Bacteroidia bacterium]|nr:IS4 family transposase [Bacteroidia bacterium]
MVIELYDFFGKLPEEVPTKSAFSQRRKLIKASFFEDLFQYSSQLFYQRFPAKTWRGFRLVAVDGTGLRIPDEDWLGEYFGWHKNQHGEVPSTRWLVCFDVLNQILQRVALHPRSTAETKIALPLVEQFGPDVLAIYDRGFNGYALPWLHLHFGSHCLVRLKKTFSPTVVYFIESGKNEGIFTSEMTYRARQAVAACGQTIAPKTCLTYRLIRVDLPTGEIEVLLTTLLDQNTWQWKHFGTLYHHRWGIETAFFTLKSFFQAAVFSAYTLPAV